MNPVGSIALRRIQQVIIDPISQCAEQRIVRVMLERHVNLSPF
jgi:hypothetical protein